TYQQQQQMYAQQQYASPPPVYAAPAAPPPAPAPAAAPADDDVTTKITQLGQLHMQGVLTDEAFAAATAKLLGISPHGRSPSRAGWGNPELRVERFLPIVGYARSYKRADLRFDVIAGVTVSALVVPKALGYAGIARVPLENGLYAAAAGCIV